MKMSIKNVFLVSMAVLAASIPVHSIFASGVATIQGKNPQDSTMQVEYMDGGKLRMNVPKKEGRDSYMLLLDGKTYVVSKSGGQTMVMDMAQLGSMARGMGVDMGGGDSFKQELMSYSKTGKSETVAGYKGSVYTLTWRDSKGTHTADAVLSGHKNVREFSEAWMEMAEAMANSMRQQIITDKSIWSFLEREGVGVLRLGEDFRVVSIEPGTVDANRFVLPAEPMKMPNMGAMGGYPSQAPSGESGEQQGSSWGALFGQKAERQKDRQVNHAERTVDHQVDKMVDKALGGALKGIFGR